MNTFSKHIILLLCLFLIYSLYADEGIWTTCSGEASLHNITHEEAQSLAKHRARRQAIEKVCGIQLQAESMIHNFKMAGDFIHSVSFGQVIEEKDTKWETINVPAKNPSNPPTVMLKVTMKVKVVRSQGNPDPGFKVKAEINRTVFQSGDEVVFHIQSTKDCYITIFSLAANDSVYIIFPNKNFKTSNFIKANAKYQIPSKNDIQNGKSISVATLPGHKEDNEVVKIIALKQNTTYLNDFNTLNRYGLIGTPIVAVNKIAQWLSTIPISERAEAAIIYKVYQN